MEKGKSALEIVGVTGHSSKIHYNRDEFSTIAFTVLFNGNDIDAAHRELIMFINDSVKKLNNELADKAER